MDQFSHFNQNTNASNNRVYINRNFNRMGADGVATLSHNNVMYLNPNFSHEKNTPHYIVQQKDHTIRPKIHVNPNFIRPKSQDVSIAISSQINTLPSVSTATNTYSHIPCTQPIQAATVNSKNTQMTTVSNSRYCLVRQNEKVVKTPLLTSLPRPQQTVKVNKYKSVSLNSVKRSLISDKKPAKPIQSNIIKLNQSHIFKTKYKISSKSTLNVQNTQFRYIKKNSTLLNSLETVQGMVRRASISHSKNILKTGFSQTKKIAAGMMKKNNIPCPQFKKYGKCLRMIRGNCDYLHDKKQVSICRKFLNGACHDRHCLLSHDLTDKKMPTCYFYLQGNCMKESCPYLHVKLNEKTKVCPNFLRGYCENGDKCVHRHVNVSSTRTKKRSSATIINNNVPKRTRVPKSNTRKEDSKPSKVALQNVNEKEFVNDQRYFKDIMGDKSAGEQYDVIKPTRCKLGTLPSYIQL